MAAKNRKLGWQTTTATRPLLVSAVADALVEGSIDVGSIDLAEQLQAFRINESGKAEAAGGAHDDDVIALGIGLYNLSAATRLPVPRSGRARKRARGRR